MAQDNFLEEPTLLHYNYKVTDFRCSQGNIVGCD